MNERGAKTIGGFVVGLLAGLAEPRAEQAAALVESRSSPSADPDADAIKRAAVIGMRAGARMRRAKPKDILEAALRGAISQWGQP